MRRALACFLAFAMLFSAVASLQAGEEVSQNTAQGTAEATGEAIAKVVIIAAIVAGVIIISSTAGTFAAITGKKKKKSSEELALLLMEVSGLAPETPLLALLSRAYDLEKEEVRGELALLFSSVDLERGLRDNEYASSVLIEMAKVLERRSLEKGREAPVFAIKRRYSRDKEFRKRIESLFNTGAWYQLVRLMGLEEG